MARPVILWSSSLNHSCLIRLRNMMQLRFAKSNYIQNPQSKHPECISSSVTVVIPWKGGGTTSDSCTRDSRGTLYMPTRHISLYITMLREHTSTTLKIIYLEWSQKIWASIHSKPCSNIATISPKLLKNIGKRFS